MVPGPATCPDDAVVDGGACVRTVAGSYRCADDTAELQGDFCVFGTGFEIDFPELPPGVVCPTGTTVDDECFRVLQPTCGDLDPGPVDPSLCKQPGTIETEVGCAGEADTIDGRCIVDGYQGVEFCPCLLYTSPSPRDATLSRMPSSA